MKKKIGVALAVCLTVISAFSAYAAPVSLPPNVTDKMCTADYWLAKTEKPDMVIAFPEEIKTINQRIINVKETGMNDLEEIPPTYNGKAMLEALPTLQKPAYTLYMNGTKISDNFFETVNKNILNAETGEDMAVGYGFSVNYSYIKEYPYDGFLSDLTYSQEEDKYLSTAVNVNEPIVVYFKSADGKFCYVKSNCYSGWMSRTDIGICSSKAEWLNIKNAENILVVTGDKIYTELSLDAPVNSGKALTMGTVLPLITGSDIPESYGNRAPWNSYCVAMPCADKDGNFYHEAVFIPQNRDVSVGYLPLTQRNIITQAFKCLGNRYGWGGMLYSQDCSSFIKNIFKCCGAEIPRDTGTIAAMPVDIIDLSGLTGGAREAAYASLPMGAILYIKGNVVIYLGKDGENHYSISALGAVAIDDKAIDVNTVTVNDFSVKRKNGRLWYDEFQKAVIYK